MEFIKIKSKINFKLKIAAPILCLVFSAGALSKDLPTAKKLCPATKGSDLPMLKGKKIQILNYIKETDTYQVNSPDFPGEGSSSVTLEGLVYSVVKIKKNLANVLHNPEDIVGGVYTTDKDLPTLMDPEIEARKTCTK